MANDDYDDFLINIEENQGEQAQTPEIGGSDSGVSKTESGELPEAESSSLSKEGHDTSSAAGNLSEQDLPQEYNIKRYANSLNQPLNAHFYAADSLINTIGETNLDWDQQKVFDSYRSKIVGSAESIIQIHDKYYYSLNEKNIAKEAEKEFYSYNESDLDKNMLQFLKLKFSYQLLKSFNLLVKELWQTIEKNFNDLANNSEIKEFALLMLQDKVNPMLLLVKQTDEFLLRMSLILNITKEDIDNYSREVQIQVDYQSGKNYSLRECFEGPVADARRQEIVKQISPKSGLGNEEKSLKYLPNKENQKEEEKFNLTHKIDKSKLGSIKDFSMDRVEENINRSNKEQAEGIERQKRQEENRIHLDLVGKKAWNQGKFYQLSYAKKDYEESLQKIRSALFYSESAEDDKEKTIRKKIAINLARRNRLNILEDYLNFLFETVDKTINDLMDYFEIPMQNRVLFAFHLGAGHMAEMQKKYLSHHKMGICYYIVRGPAGNKIKKEFYPVMVEDSVKRYWESRINPAYNDGFDNFWEFSRISDVVRQKYQNEVEIHRRKLDAIFAKMGTSKAALMQKENYFQDHFIDWFGLRNIYVYKRFVDRSIFVNWTGNDVIQRRKAGKKKGL